MPSTTFSAPKMALKRKMQNDYYDMAMVVHGFYLYDRLAACTDITLEQSVLAMLVPLMLGHDKLDEIDESFSAAPMSTKVKEFS